MLYPFFFLSPAAPTCLVQRRYSISVYWKNTERAYLNYRTLLCCSNLLFGAFYFKLRKLFTSSLQQICGLCHAPLFLDIPFTLQDLFSTFLHPVPCPGKLTSLSRRCPCRLTFSWIQPLKETIRRWKMRVRWGYSLPHTKSPLSFDRLAVWKTMAIGSPCPLDKSFPTALWLHDSAHCEAQMTSSSLRGFSWFVHNLVRVNLLHSP